MQPYYLSCFDVASLQRQAQYCAEPCRTMYSYANHSSEWTSHLQQKHAEAYAKARSAYRVYMGIPNHD